MTKTLTPAQRLDLIEPKVQRLNRVIIEGNGEPSLREQMRDVLKFIQEQRDEKKSLDEARKANTRIIWAAVVAQLITLAASFIVWIFNILPVIERLNMEILK